MQAWKRMACSLAVVAATLLPAGAALAAAQTAKAALPRAITAAQAWQSDAVLVGLSSISVRSNGRAFEWKYSFYSPGTKKRCVVTAHEAEVSAEEVASGSEMRPLRSFIDSDAAMREAKKNGLKGYSPTMAIRRHGSGASSATYWVVNGGLEKGDVSVFLEAATGKFYTTAEIQ